EQDDRDAGRHYDPEVQPVLPGFQLAEPDRERQCEEEPEQNLHAESTHPQFLQQLGEIPVVALLRCLTGAPRRSHRREGLHTRRIRIGARLPRSVKSKPKTLAARGRTPPAAALTVAASSPLPLRLALLDERVSPFLGILATEYG